MWPHSPSKCQKKSESCILKKFEQDCFSPSSFWNKHLNQSVSPSVFFFPCARLLLLSMCSTVNDSIVPKDSGSSIRDGSLQTHLTDLLVLSDKNHMISFFFSHHKLGKEMFTQCSSQFEEQQWLLWSKSYSYQPRDCPMIAKWNTKQWCFFKNNNEKDWLNISYDSNLYHYGRHLQ